MGVRRPQQRRLHAPLRLDGIARHQIVRYRASPDDPALTDYWTWRRRKAPLPINQTRLWLLQAQNGRCAICRGTLRLVEDRPELPQQWERWLATNSATIITTTTPTAGTTGEAEPRLIHADCTNRKRTALLPAYQPSGLA